MTTSGGYMDNDTQEGNEKFQQTTRKSSKIHIYLSIIIHGVIMNPETLINKYVDA
jgi:hypothetical protein